MSDIENDENYGMDAPEAVVMFLVVREDPSADDEFSLHTTRDGAIAAAKEYEAENDDCVFTEEQIDCWEYSSQSDPASGDGPMVRVEAIEVQP